MPSLRCVQRTLLAACIVVPLAGPLAAQDSLRVLRFAPLVPASVADPVVITFDHPVAPRLDDSVDPDRAVRVSPEVGHHSYWRDPSTLVVEFDSLWVQGTRYRVMLDPGLRSEGGLPLARSALAREVIVGGARVLHVSQSANEGPADTIVHALAVFGTPVTLESLAGGAMVLPDSALCVARQPIPLRAVAVRPIGEGDSYYIREAGGYARDRRLDSLRRVVELVASRPVGRGCIGRLSVSSPDPRQGTFFTPLRVRPVFRARAAVCRYEMESSCLAGRPAIIFTAPVAAEEVRRHVRVDGRVPRLDYEMVSEHWVVLDSAAPRSRHVIEVDSTLRSAAGERIEGARRFVLEVAPPERGVGMSSGSFVVPRSDGRLIAIRYGGVDSVVVVVARVADSLRGRALTHWDNYGRSGLQWRAVRGDSIVLRYPVRARSDSERVLVVPITDLPAAWRALPVLAVRARGVQHDTLADPDHAAPGGKPSSNGIHQLKGVSIIAVDMDHDGLEPHFAILRRTDLATHVRHAHGEARVWVTGVRDARPRAGTTVRVVTGAGEELARGTTDQHGLARLDYRPPSNAAGWKGQLLLEARLGDDVSLELLPGIYYGYRGDETDDDDEPQPRPRATEARVGLQPRLRGAAFADRGIYRPGEAVYLKGIVRRSSAALGYTAARGDSARWVVRWLGQNWPGDRVWTRRARLGDFGTTVDTFTVVRTARLGVYTASLELRQDGAWHKVAHASFAVGEYRVPEFTVRASADSATPLFAGDTARVRVEARYLFGLPMQGAKVEWWGSLHESDPWETRIPGLEGLTVGRSWWQVSRTPDEAVRGVLPLRTDANGVVTIAVPVPALSRPGRLQLFASTTDENRQSINGSITLPVQAADVYVGARLAQPRWIWPTREPMPIQALVVGVDGRRRAGVPVRLLAVRHGWADGRETTDTVWRAERLSTLDTMRVAFTPTSTGSMELLLVARDARGREATTGLFAWVASPNQPWMSWTRNELPLTADKPRYAVGDRASIRVDASDDGPAWLTLSGDGMLLERLVQLRRGANVLSVEIPEGAIPRATLSVLALHQIPPGDTSRAYTRSGQIVLNVAPDARALRVALVPERRSYSPRERVRLALHVRDAAGRGVRSEAAVWAVDEGVASLTRLEKPHLLEQLQSAAGDWYSLASSLNALIPWLPPGVRSQFLQTSYGGAAGAGSTAIQIRGASTVNRLEANVVTTAVGSQPSIREIFATTPLYRGAVATDANGDATVEFDLPDNLTTFHLFAAAVGEGAQAGAGDTSIVSSRVLAVRPALPRVVRDGDTLLAGAVITQDRDGPSPVTLRVEGTGIGIDGSTSRLDTLDGRRAREIRFSMRGVGGDTAVLRFRGTTPTDGDAVEARLPVSPAGHPRASVMMGTLHSDADVAFPISEALDTRRSRLELQLGSSALPMLHRLSESLRLYPYFCTEQLSSGGRALVARVRAERMSGGPAALAERDRRQLEMGVSTILARQRYDGGFGYWSATNWSTPWLTGYALEFLLGARDLGVEVPEGSVTRAREYLGSASARVLRDTLWRWRLASAVSDTVVSVGDLIAVARSARALGQPDGALELRLRALRGRMQWVDRLSVAQLLAARGDSAEARAILADAWSATRAEGRRIVLDDSTVPRSWIFRSVLRPAATLLATAAQLTPDDDRLGPLFESLIQVGTSGSRWGMNTIDQALAADAVLAMLRPQAAADGSVSSRSVAVSSRGEALGTMTAGSARADTMRIPLAPTLARGGAVGDSARIALRGSSGGATYFAATLYEVPVARPVRADDEGISVDRWYERFDDARPTLSVREGELVRVRLRITVPRDREFVAIEDPLPAGLEAVDLSLRTSSSLPPYAGAPRLQAQERAEGPLGQRWLFGSWDGGWWTPWEHREIRDDRVTYFARQLWKGSYLVSYVARATTAGTFVRPPTHAEEMYNPAVHGRSDGGWFTVVAGR